MRFPGFLDACAEILAPTRCAGCERLGTVLCDHCIEVIQGYRMKHRCPRCGAPYGELICTECEGQEFVFNKVICLGELDGPLSRAVVIYKDVYEVRLGSALGDLLAQQCVHELSMTQTRVDVVTWIPPTVRAYRRRGYDHAGILAQHVARHLGCSAIQHLKRCRMRDMRRLSREQRIIESHDSFAWLAEKPDLHGARVLVVDDVMTTGATLNGATRMLIDAGAAIATGVVVARAW